MADQERRVPGSEQLKREMFTPSPEGQVERPQPTAEQQEAAQERLQAQENLAEALRQSAFEKVPAAAKYFEGDEMGRVQGLIEKFNELAAQKSSADVSAEDYAKQKRDIFTEMNVVLDKALDRIQDEAEAAEAEVAVQEEEDTVFESAMGEVELQRGRERLQGATEEFDIDLTAKSDRGVETGDFQIDLSNRFEGMDEDQARWERWIDQEEDALVELGVIDNGMITNKDALLDRANLGEEYLPWLENLVSNRESTLQAQAGEVLRDAHAKGFVDRAGNWVGEAKQVMDNYGLNPSDYNVLIKRVQQKLKQKQAA